MTPLINIVVILAVLGVAGWLKLPYEQQLSEELHTLKLIPPRLSLQERSKLKQKAFVVTYGSLRPTIAAFMSVKTEEYHSNLEWDNIENTFEEIVLLDPYNYYYWDMASWHMALNASVDKQEDKTLTEIGKKQVFKKYIQKGKDIINKGIKVNPDDWRYLNLKAKLESNRHRNPDYPAAIETYTELLALPGLTPRIKRSTEISLQFIMQKLPERHQESYDHALALFNKGKTYHVPTIQNEILIGQNHPLNKVTNHLTTKEIYGSDANAYRQLKTRWQRHNNEDKKLYGVQKTLKTLENALNIHQDKRLFQYQPMFMK